MIKTICIVGADEGDVVISKRNSPDVVFFDTNGAILRLIGNGAWSRTQIEIDLVSAIICNQAAWKTIISSPGLSKFHLKCFGSFTTLLFRFDFSSIRAQFSAGQLPICPNSWWIKKSNVCQNRSNRYSNPSEETKHPTGRSKL